MILPPFRIELSDDILLKVYISIFSRHGWLVEITSAVVDAPLKELNVVLLNLNYLQSIYTQAKMMVSPPPYL